MLKCFFNARAISFLDAIEYFLWAGVRVCVCVRVGVGFFLLSFETSKVEDGF